MSEAEIANGCAKVPTGEWLMSAGQPVAATADCRLQGQRGWLVPDRSFLQVAAVNGAAFCASADRPFLTRLNALPDESLVLVSAKVLVAPKAARVGAHAVKLVPMSLTRALTATEFRGGWVVTATRSRVTRVAVSEDESLLVKPEALVAWTGPAPTGFCKKLGLMDLLLPRGPRHLQFRFQGPAVVWFEGASVAQARARKAVRR